MHNKPIRTGDRDRRAKQTSQQHTEENYSTNPNKETARDPAVDDASPSSSGAEAADEARQVEVAVAVGGGGAAVEVDELVAVRAEVAVDEALDVDEAVDAAGDGDGALVPEAVLALGLVEQRPEERVLEVVERHGEAALLLPLRPHAHRHAPLGRHHLRPVVLLLLLPEVHRRRGPDESSGCCEEGGDGGGRSDGRAREAGGGVWG